MASHEFHVVTDEDLNRLHAGIGQLLRSVSNIEQPAIAEQEDFAEINHSTGSIKSVHEGGCMVQLKTVVDGTSSTDGAVTGNIERQGEPFFLPYGRNVTIIHDEKWLPRNAVRCTQRFTVDEEGNQQVKRHYYLNPQFEDDSSRLGSNYYNDREVM